MCVYEEKRNVYLNLALDVYWIVMMKYELVDVGIMNAIWEWLSILTYIIDNVDIEGVVLL